jgi:hypothetical protein
MTASWDCPLAHGADPPDDILRKGVQLGSGGHGTERMHARSANRDRRIGRSRKDLEGQIADFDGLVRLRLPAHDSRSQKERKGSHAEHLFRHAGVKPGIAEPDYNARGTK